MSANNMNDTDLVSRALEYQAIKKGGEAILKEIKARLNKGVVIQGASYGASGESLTWKTEDDLVAMFNDMGLNGEEIFGSLKEKRPRKGNLILEKV